MHVFVLEYWGFDGGVGGVFVMVSLVFINVFVWVIICVCMSLSLNIGGLMGGSEECL